MKDQMISKGPLQVQGSRIHIDISKAKCDSMFAGLLSWLLYLNSFKLRHRHYFSISLQSQVTRNSIFFYFYFLTISVSAQLLWLLLLFILVGCRFLEFFMQTVILSVNNYFFFPFRSLQFLFCVCHSLGEGLAKLSL